MRRLLATSLLLFLAAAPGFAEEDQDPIDTALAECLDAPDGQSTQGMVECLGAAYEAWDRALNDAYRALIDSLTESQREMLKAAQRKWIDFRDAESDFQASLVTPEAGSIMRVTTNEAIVNVIKARVLALRSALAE